MQQLYLQKGGTVLCIASWHSDDKIVELLLRRKADVNHRTMVRFHCWHSWQYNYCRVYPFVQDGSTPLMIASQQGHIHAVSLLMDNGAHVNLQNEVPTKTLQAWMCAYMVL